VRATSGHVLILQGVGQALADADTDSGHTPALMALAQPFGKRPDDTITGSTMRVT
jgi:hypothetical protein